MNDLFLEYHKPQMNSDEHRFVTMYEKVVTSRLGTQIVRIFADLFASAQSMFHPIDRINYVKGETL